MANAVYWIGQDGNVWVRDGDTTRNMGQPGSGTIQANDSYSAMGGSGFATRIDDPNPGNVGPTTAPTGGDGGGAAAPVFNQAAASNTQRTIDEIPGLLEAALATEAQRYKNAIAEFGTQEKQQRGVYDESTVTNQKNYDANYMDSIRAGIKGLGGLMNLLRGTGAAGGTAEDEVRDVVGGVTANDIRTGADTQKENQMSLDTSLSSFLTELDRKRRMNEDTLENNKRAVRRDADTQLQDLYGKMAGFYSDAGNTAEYNNWMSKAGEITPRIAQNSRTALSEYDTTPIAVQAPKITAFAGPTQPSVVAPTNEGQVGAGLFTMSDRNRRKEQVAPLVPAGA